MTEQKDSGGGEGTTVTLDDWELGEMRRLAASNALTFLTHYGADGLFRREVPTMNRWRKLSDKLAGKEYAGDLEYRGIRRNGFNPNGED